MNLNLKGDYEAARQQLDKLYEIARTDGERRAALFAKAVSYFEKAIELDSNFAGAWSLKGYTHMQDIAFGFSKSPVQSIKQAEECAQKAIALDDSNAKATWVSLCNH